MDVTRGWTPPQAFWAYLDAARERIRERAPAADAFASELNMMLNRASDTIVRDFESAALKDFDLNWSQYRVLHCLWLAGPLEQRKVADVTGMSRALVSSTVKLLTGRQLVTSVTAVRDGRMRQLSLTQSGQDTIGRAYRAQNAREAEWVATLTPAERAILLMLLRKLARGDGDDPRPVTSG